MKDASYNPASLFGRRFILCRPWPSLFQQGELKTYPHYFHPTKGRWREFFGDGFSCDTILRIIVILFRCALSLNIVSILRTHPGPACPPHRTSANCDPPTNFVQPWSRLCSRREVAISLDPQLAGDGIGSKQSNLPILSFRWFTEGFSTNFICSELYTFCLISLIY